MASNYTRENEYDLVGEFAQYFNIQYAGFGDDLSVYRVEPIDGWENLPGEVTSYTYTTKRYKVYDDGSRVLYEKSEHTAYLKKTDDTTSVSTSRWGGEATHGWVIDKSKGDNGSDHTRLAIVNIRNSDLYDNMAEASVALNEDGAKLEWLSLSVSGGVLDASKFAFTAITEAGREFASKLEFVQTIWGLEKIKLKDGEAVEKIPHEFTITVHNDGEYVGVFTVGGDAGKRIHGDSSDNIIRGNSSNDKIYGYDGDDTIYGRAGDDTIYGGDGVDTINGGRGNDVIYGNGGNDRINGSYGDNVIYGGDGDDDIIVGLTPGNNRLYGGDGIDNITGGTGNDYLEGGDGNDALYANGGKDILYGGNGDDRLYGDGQSDIFVLDLDNTGKDTVGDFKQGEDKIRITRSDYAQITIDGNIIRDAGGNDVFVLKVFDGHYNTPKDFDGVLTIDDFDIIDDTMGYDGEVKIVTPKIEFLTGRVDKLVDKIFFTFNRAVEEDEFNVVGIFAEDNAPAEKLEVKLFGTVSHTDKQIYYLQEKEGQKFEYNGDADYLNIEYDGEYVGGGAIVVDIY